MKKCDYEITYYQDGNPKTFRIPALEVDDNMTPEELNDSLKQQIKDVFKTALRTPEHILHQTITDLTQAGIIFQTPVIRSLPTTIASTSVGVMIEASKTSYDGNVKLSDLKAHLDTAKHPYKGLLLDILKDEDLTQPVLHLIAERHNVSGLPADAVDSAFGVYIRGINGFDTIKVFGGTEAVDLDIFNIDPNAAKVLAHQLLHYKISKKLDEWARKNPDNFDSTFNPIMDTLYSELDSDTYNMVFSEGEYYDNSVADLFAYALVDKDLPRRLNNIQLQRDEDNPAESLLNRLYKYIRNLLGISMKHGSVLQEILNHYENLKYVNIKNNGGMYIGDPGQVDMFDSYESKEEVKPSVIEFPKELEVPETQEGKDAMLVDYMHNEFERNSQHLKRSLLLLEFQRQNQSIGTLEDLLFPNRDQQIYNADGSFVRLQTLTDKKPPYSLEYLGYNTDLNSKIAKLSETLRGSAIMLNYNEAFTFIRFDKDLNAAVTLVKVPGSTKTVKLPNGSMESVTVEPHYEEKLINPNDIIAIAHNNVEYKELDIEPSQKVLKSNRALLDDFKRLKQYKRFTTLEAAKSYAKTNGLDNYVPALQYILNDDNSTFIKPEESNIKDTRYVLKNTKSGELVPNFTTHNYVSASVIDATPTKGVIESLKPGDIIGKNFETTSGIKYIEGFITDINENAIIVSGFNLDKNTNSLNRFDFMIPIDGEQKSGYGLKDVVRIGYSYKNNDDADLMVDDFNYAVATGQFMIPPVEDELTSKDALPKGESPFSKDFESSDPRDYRKSSKTSSELLKALSSNLESIYGVKMNLMDSSEIAEMFDINPSAPLLYSKQRAFIMNNEVFINTDKASLAEPIHELGHIILQGLKASNNSLYQSIISKFAAHPQYQSVAKYYPNLDPDSLTEEVFVTTLGEMFNGNLSKEPVTKWTNENKGFLSNLFSSIKNFFVELFGINKKSFFDLDPNELMNMSFEDIHSNFGNSILNGEFTSETEIAKLRQDTIMNGTYLMSSNGTRSTLYNSLRELNFSDSEASELWLKTKSSAFRSWSNGTLLENDDNEPRLFVRTTNPFRFEEASIITDKSLLVYIKGNITQDGNTIKVLSPNQVRSIHNTGYLERIDNNYDTVTEYANNFNIDLEGSERELNLRLPDLRSAFPGYIFEIKQGFGTNYISYYKAPTEDVRLLREQLMKNNNINRIC